MAIKISGTTVIGDTKEVINVSSAGINTDNSQGNLLFINGSTENITITSDGFVGIGTTFFNSSTPRVALDVYATDGISANLLGVGTSKALTGDRVTIGNDDDYSSSDQSILGFYNFNSSADNRRWVVGPKGEVFFLQALDDSNPGAGGGNRIAIGRSDNELRSFELRSGDVPFFYADFYEKNIGIGTTSPVSGLYIGGPDGKNVYIDVKNVPERQLIFDNGNTYCYFYMNASNSPQGESFGAVDSSLSAYPSGGGANRNIWYYDPVNVVLNLADTDLKVGIASTQPSHPMDVGGTVSATNYVSSGCLTSTSDTNLSIDASLYAHVFREASFTANRLHQIYNLTPGREIKIFIKNTNATARTMTFEASETTSGYSNVRISDSLGNAYTDNNAVSVPSTDIRLITIMNMNGNFVGGC